MGRTDSFEKTLLLGKIEGVRRRGWQRMKWLDSMDVNLSKFQELVMNREAWRTAIHGIIKSRTQQSDWTELNSLTRNWTWAPCIGSAVLATGSPGKSLVYLFEWYMMIEFSLDVCPAMGLLDRMITLFLVFYGISIPFPIVITPIYIPSNNEGAFPFLCTLPRNYYL